MQAAGDWSDAARFLADHCFSLALDGHAGTIQARLQSFPQNVCSDEPELALAYAVNHVLQGNLDEAAAHLGLAESHISTTSRDRHHRLRVTAAWLRLSLARRRGHFADVVEQVNFLASTTSGPSIGDIALRSDLRAAALMDLGIVELWSLLLPDAERHLEEGAALAKRIGRPYLEVGCRAQLGFTAKSRSFATARRQCHEAIALAKRHGLQADPVIAPAFATLGGAMVWMGEFDQGERWLHRAAATVEDYPDPATTLLVHLSSGMLQAGRGRHDLAIEEFTAAERIPPLLVGEHILAPAVSGWKAASLARLGRPAPARALLADLTDWTARLGEVRNAAAALHLAEGNPHEAIEALRAVIDRTVEVTQDITRVEAHLLAARAHRALGNHGAALAEVEAGLALAEPDRLILPFAMTDSRDTLEELRQHRTAHPALVADILDVLRGVSPRTIDSRSRRDPGSAPVSSAFSDISRRTSHAPRSPSNCRSP
jgi:LuxR family maltose regulon positive regulatory protein